jgi:diguanylate cyclase (GGDEF)-like protein/PAS domain S-box-containing protein
MTITDNPDLMARLLIQSVTDYAIYLLTPQGIIANWNPGAERAKGYTASEIVGHHFALFYTDHERAADIPMFNLGVARATGRFEDEGWRIRKDGTAFRAHVVIDAIHDDDGLLVGFAKITKDITERHRYDMELLKAKELAEKHHAEMASASRFLDSVVANIPASVIVQDMQTRTVLLANQRAAYLFGDGRQMVGSTARQCFAREVADYLAHETAKAIDNQGIQISETTLPTAHGSRTLRSRSLVGHNTHDKSDYVLLITEDVTEEIEAHARIRHMAHHDALTGLPNRNQFRERLDEALASSRTTGSLTATLCLDLDNFKNINDALGHAFGDKLLCALGARLGCELRDQDILARLGGDEFAIVLPQLAHASAAQRTAQRIINAMAPPFLVDGHSLSVGVSVGISMAPQDHDAAEQLLRYADMALYEAKRNGRNRYECFRLELDETARKRRMMEADLRTALHLGQLELHYQPVMEIQTNEISGYEALMRWPHPTKGMIMPADFIHVAEETGLIHQLGIRALNLACQEAAGWEGQQSVAVNLSPIQFKSGALVEIVSLALADSGLAPSRLELEITESVLLDNTEANLCTLRALKALGVAISLDDFGTGYSSLGYLRSFPFDRIKIDKSFVADMAQSRESLSIIRAITEMSRSLLIKTTAEGVETLDQLERLKAEGCSHLQGYLFGRPVPAKLRRSSLEAGVGVA